MSPPGCGKLCLSLNKAKGIVLAAWTYYRHDPSRQERAYYWCQRCKSWHTTSQVL
jgi:hypothetical protein